MLRKLRTAHSVRAIQVAVSLAIAAGCVWWMSSELTPAFWHEVLLELRVLHPVSLLLAFLCACTSFMAIGRYDAVAHRHFRTGISTRHACLSGTIAIALGQTVGLGVLTGALARWRMLRGVTFPTALRLSVFVSATFMAALVIITACACLMFPAPPFAFWPSVFAIALVPLTAAAAFFCPVLHMFRLPLRLPSLLALSSILLWTAIDTVAAATALYLVLPDQTVAFHYLLPVFLIALTAALISGTPGGVGPFELVLFACLPTVQTVDLLSGIVAFRALYYALPALLAMIALLRPMPPPIRLDRPDPLIGTAPRAEVGVIRQNGGYVLPAGHTRFAVWPTGQALCALFDPLDRACAGMIPALHAAARHRNLMPLLYKCSAKPAVLARLQGWHVAHIADEAVVTPWSHNSSTPAYRGLRRKLRAARNAGITVHLPSQSGSPLPITAMRHIDKAWQVLRGRARGGTMGTFCPVYLSDQKVFLAYQGQTLIAFASFHATHAEWCLDLMRHAPEAPDGTMHLLIHEAITHAAARSVPRLSLAAVPACPDPASAPMRWLAGVAVRKSGGPGLRQFKSAFRPRWQPLYAAAPNAAVLTLGLADVARAVHRRGAPQIPAQPHHDDENYEVASRLAS
jgi:phosphatidylglycerol lysyltransferase